MVMSPWKRDITHQDSHDFLEPHSKKNSLSISIERISHRPKIEEGPFILNETRSGDINELDSGVHETDSVSSHQSQG